MEAQNVNKISNRVAMILWGTSKTGKTTYACSAPGRKLIVNFDPDGYSTVADRDDVDVIDLSLDPPSDALKKAQQAPMFIKENAEKYGTVILDNMTTLMEVCLHDAINNKIGASSKFVPSLDTPGLIAYGARNNRFNEVFGKLTRATGQHNLNFIAIAHQDDPQFSEDGRTIVEQTMLLPSKPRQQSSIKTSEIWYIDIASGRRTLYLHPFGTKKPMGSRMFDTSKVSKFELKYTIHEDDDDQGHSLTSIIESWHNGGKKKLTKVPKQ